jgi:hypothetical protein
MANAEKLSVTVPAQLAKRVRSRVGSRGLSSFVARAVQHELEREQLGSYLEELDESHRSVNEKDLETARSLWHKR